MMKLAWIVVYWLVGIVVMGMIASNYDDEVFVMAIIWPLLLILTLVAIIWKYCVHLLEWVKEKQSMARCLNYLLDFDRINTEYDLLIENKVKEMRNTWDNLVFETFKRYGYSKEWLMANSHRVERITNRNESVDIFTVDYEPLFKIIHTGYYEFDDRRGRICVKFNTSVEYIKEK